MLCSHSASDVTQLNNPSWSWQKPSDPCLDHVSKQAEEKIKYFEEQMIPCWEKKKICLWSLCTSLCLFTHSLSSLFSEWETDFQRKKNSRDLTWREGKITRFIHFLSQNWPAYHEKWGPHLLGWTDEEQPQGSTKCEGAVTTIRLKTQPSWGLLWIFQIWNCVPPSYNWQLLVTDRSWRWN